MPLLFWYFLLLFYSSKLKVDWCDLSTLGSTNAYKNGKSHPSALPSSVCYSSNISLYYFTRFFATGSRIAYSRFRKKCTYFFVWFPLSVSCNCNDIKKSVAVHYGCLCTQSIVSIHFCMLCTYFTFFFCVR